MKTTEPSQPAGSGSPGLFPPTMWSAVIEARDEASPRAAEALERLARAYWRPLYIFVRQRGRAHEAAEDDVQGFFAHLLGRDFLRFVTPREGRFRTFLLAAFTRWLNDQHDRAVAAKRGGGQPLLSLDEFEELRETAVAPGDPPEAAFDRRWARELCAHALARVAEAWSGRVELFEALSPLLAGERPDADYASIGARLGMTEGAVKKAAFDLRALYARRIREEVRLTVGDESAVDEELRYLIRLLRT